MSIITRKRYELNYRYKCMLLAFAWALFIVRSIQMIFQVSAPLAYPAATLYLFDFNFYIGTRTFVGSILTLLTPHITYQQIFVINLVVFVTLILAFASLWFYTAKKSIMENNNALFLVLFVFITFPYSVLQYASWVGAYDIYLCLFAVLCALTALSKKAHWLFPVLCIMAIFTHYSFVLAYFPAAFAVHIYCIFKSKDKDKKWRIISSAAALLSSFISTVYCVFFANNTVKMNRSELFVYMEGRLGIPAENERYIDAYYFNDDVIGMIGRLQKGIFNQGLIKNAIIFFFPLMIFFCLIWCHCIIKSKKNQIFPYLCFAGTAAVNIALVFIIMEYPRWLAAAVLSQFIILFALIKKEDAFVVDIFKRLNKSDSFIWFVIYVAVAVFASLFIEPYNVYA